MRRCSGYFERLALLLRARGFAGAALLCLLALAGSASAQPRSERDIKCLLFVTLARYTEWPADAFPSETAPVIIGVLGDDPFGGMLESMTKNEKVRDRPILVRRFASSDEVERCHALFFGGMSVLQRELELSRLRRRQVLTVSDAPGFARDGGMVEMYINDENKVRLRISRSALSRGGLSISQAIMRVADVVAMIEWVPETAEGRLPDPSPAPAHAKAWACVPRFAGFPGGCGRSEHSACLPWKLAACAAFPAAAQ